MYRLYLLRHAEAVNGRPGAADFDRPLSQCGRSDATVLGRRMRAEGYLPSLALCSTAKRTRETLEIVIASLEQPIETLHLPELYRGNEADYQLLLAAMPQRESLLVVGHNPMIETLANTLADDRGEVSARFAKGFPAGALAMLEFEETLEHIGHRRGKLAAFLSPLR